VDLFFNKIATVSYNDVILFVEVHDWPELWMFSMIEFWRKSRVRLVDQQEVCRCRSLKVSGVVKSEQRRIGHKVDQECSKKTSSRYIQANYVTATVDDNHCQFCT
jgi:hypothetical protein